jgi:copper(I)-binding protein
MDMLAGYARIDNACSTPVEIVSASSPAFADVSLHETRVENGISRMRALTALPVAAHGSVAFAPGSLHLMIIGLVAPLVQGDKVPFTLKFEKAGEISVSFDVRAMGAPAPGPLSNIADPTAHAAAKM